MANDLVTAVMVTGKSKERYPLAAAAIKSVEQQTWPSKQLVIVTDDYDAALHYGQRSYAVPTKTIYVSGPKTLGELRNEGLKEADGAYVMQLDDDDWSHPDRIKEMMRAASPTTAVTLMDQVRYSFNRNCAFAYRRVHHQGICGTVLHAKLPELAYEPIGKHEDCRFLDTHFKGRVTVLDNHGLPQLYIRFFHGANTWDEDHVMCKHVRDRDKDQWYLSEEQKTYLKEVLDREYRPSSS